MSKRGTLLAGCKGAPPPKPLVNTISVSIHTELPLQDLSILNKSTILPRLNPPPSPQVYDYSKKGKKKLSA